LVCRTTAGEIILRCGRWGIAVCNSTVIWDGEGEKQDRLPPRYILIPHSVESEQSRACRSGSSGDKQGRVAVSGRPPANSNAAAIKAGVLGPEVFQARHHCTRLHKPQFSQLRRPTLHCCTHDQLLHPPHPPSFDSSLPISLRTPHPDCRHRTEPSPITHARDLSPSRLHHRHNHFPMLISP
jgi:hypothetical protein